LPLEENVATPCIPDDRLELFGNDISSKRSSWKRKFKSANAAVKRRTGFTPSIFDENIDAASWRYEMRHSQPFYELLFRKEYCSSTSAEAPVLLRRHCCGLESPFPRRQVPGFGRNSARYPLNRYSLFILALSCLFAVAACKKQEKTSPWVGVWKLDVSKSKLNEAPKQETMQIESADQSSLKYSIRGVSAEGQEYVESYDGKPDGNAYPVKVNGKELGKIAFRWQSDRMCNGEGKGPGGSSLTETATLSDDGKTITIKSREGKEEEETAVYTK
jgi:hypothetical protein